MYRIRSRCYLSSLHHARHIRRRAQETLAAKAENQHTYIQRSRANTKAKLIFICTPEKVFIVAARLSHKSEQLSARWGRPVKLN